jgi:hypothetical protein
MQYQHPIVKDEKISIVSSAQYILEVTPDCPTYVERGIAFQDNLAIFCSDSGGDGATFLSATLICSNIDEEFTLTTGDITPGGGLTCPEGESSFTQPFTIEPDLPSDCIIDQILVNLDGGLVDACNFAG